MEKTNIICITPVKNEAWILKNFIECAQTWADFIIIGDNNSSDGSTNFLYQLDNVEVIDLGSCYDENNSRKKLIEAARKIPGKRLIVSIDADEMLSADCKDSSEWEVMLNAPLGTGFVFDWVALLPGLRHCLIESEMPAAFIDDDTEYSGIKIHSPRIPDASGKQIKLEHVKLLHYIYIDPYRMFSKHRLYKCLELIENQNRPWQTCIKYQDTQIKGYGKPALPIQEKWLDGFNWLIKYRASEKVTEDCYWYDVEVLNYFDKYGTKKFSKLNIWDVDWNKKAKLLGRAGIYNDPRSWSEKRIHNFIEAHREELKISRSFLYRAIRLFGKTVLRAFGW